MKKLLVLTLFGWTFAKIHWKKENIIQENSNYEIEFEIENDVEPVYTNLLIFIKQGASRFVPVIKAQNKENRVTAHYNYPINDTNIHYNLTWVNRSKYSSHVTLNIVNEVDQIKVIIKKRILKETIYDQIEKSGIVYSISQPNVAVKNDVLILNSKMEKIHNPDDPNLQIDHRLVGNMDPVILGYDGNYRKPNFEFGANTVVWGSCNVQFQNIHYVFGGYPYNQQISQINGCRLERTGDLPFTFDEGSCGKFNFPNENVLLCFGNKSDEKKGCQLFDGKNFTDLGIVANYAHSASQKDIANYKSQPMAVGGCFPPHNSCHKKAEIMRRVDQADRMWEEIEEYPVGSRLIYYGSVSMESKVVFFGSNSDESLGYFSNSGSNSIVTYDGQWTVLDQTLLNPRKGYSVINNGNTALIVGGTTNLKTEFWEMDESDSIITISKLPQLENYSLYPALFHVEPNFCL